MDASTPSNPHGLAAPTAQDLLASLGRMVGAEQAAVLWANACRRAGVYANGAALSLDQLEAALQQLKLERGLPSIAASSTLVRVKGYRTLSILKSM